jgi:hydroxymethylpyrimidine pyrophosphatase-like HAD family hydrolase
MSTPKTIFCDIDGTLIEHKQDIIKNIYEEPVILPNVIENIKLWDKLNYKIILITGRQDSTRRQTEQQFSELGIVYDQLVMGITNGDRIIINDKKLNGINNTCFAINLVRNNGLKFIDITSKIIGLPEEYLNTKIENDYELAELVECNDKYCVKKIIKKNAIKSTYNYHQMQTKTITVLSGELIINKGQFLESLEKITIFAGNSIIIKPYTIYNIENLEEVVYLEISSNELWDNIKI